MLLTPLTVLNKPDMGAGCNGCGHCCHEEACTFSIEHMKSTVAPCIALEWTGERFVCGAMAHPHKYLGIKWAEADEMLIPMIKKLLGAGEGCSCPNPGDD